MLGNRKQGVACRRNDRSARQRHAPDDNPDQNPGRPTEYGGPEKLVIAEYALPPLGEAHTLPETSPELFGRIVVLPWA